MSPIVIMAAILERESRLGTPSNPGDRSPLQWARTAFC
jgi:hypothetical protein